jgi:predicted aconitase with swiveling domain
MKPVVLHGRKVVGGKVEGEALVTRDTISGWGGIDPGRGVITERRHELRGQSFKDKVPRVLRAAPACSTGRGWPARRRKRSSSTS